MVEHTGRSDPLLSLGLLWRTKTKTGRSGLTLDAVVGTAITLADEIGIEQLSMRRLAERIGVGTMSLYAHVPGKPDLIDLMVDQVNAEAWPETTTTAQHAAWRDAAEAVAERNWELVSRHRWLLDVDETRPALGPGTIAKYDTELRPFTGIGLDDSEIDQVLALLLGHVRAVARLSLGIDRMAALTGHTDAEWWDRAGPVLAAHVDPRRFPYAARIGEAAGSQHGGAGDPGYTYAFGLRLILDGVEDLLSRRTTAG